MHLTRSYSSFTYLTLSWGKWIGSRYMYVWKFFLAIAGCMTWACKHSCMSLTYPSFVAWLLSSTITGHFWCVCCLSAKKWKCSSVFGAYQGPCFFLPRIMDWYILYCFLWDLEHSDHCSRVQQEWAALQEKVTAKAGGATVSLEWEQHIWLQYSGQTSTQGSSGRPVVIRQVWSQVSKGSLESERYEAGQSVT